MNQIREKSVSLCPILRLVNMKKILMMALAAVFTLPVFAQDDPLYTSSDNKVTFDMFGHLGFGYNIVSTNDFKPSGGPEFFLNLVYLDLFPTEHLGVKMGVDMDFNGLGSKESAFIQDSNHLIKAVDFASVRLDDLGSLTKTRGGIDVFSLTAPVLLKGRFNKFEIGLGAEASYNIACSTYYTYRLDNRNVQVTESKAKVNPFTYGFMATLSYEEFGLYVKYRPKNVHLLPEGGVDASFVTVGIVLGM